MGIGTVIKHNKVSCMKQQVMDTYDDKLYLLCMRLSMQHTFPIREEEKKRTRFIAINWEQMCSMDFNGIDA